MNTEKRNLSSTINLDKRSVSRVKFAYLNIFIYFNGARFTIYPLVCEISYFFCDIKIPAHITPNRRNFNVSMKQLYRLLLNLSLYF